MSTLLQLQAGTAQDTAGVFPAVSLGGAATIGSRIIVAVYNGSRTISSIVDSAGTSYSALVSQNVGSHGRIDYWSGIAAATDAGASVVVTLSGSDGNAGRVVVFEVAGTDADQSGIDTGTNTSTGATSHNLGEVAPSTINDFIISVSGHGNSNGEWTYGGGFTEVLEIAGCSVGYLVNPGTTTPFEVTATTSNNVSSSSYSIAIRGVEDSPAEITGTGDLTASVATVAGSGDVAVPLTEVVLTGTLIDQNNDPVSDATGLTVLLWEGPIPSGAPDQTLTAQVTDENGDYEFVFDIGSLSQDDPVYFLVYMGNPPTAQHCGPDASATYQ